VLGYGSTWRKAVAPSAIDLRGAVRGPKCRRPVWSWRLVRAALLLWVLVETRGGGSWQSHNPIDSRFPCHAGCGVFAQGQGIRRSQPMWTLAGFSSPGGSARYPVFTRSSSCPSTSVILGTACRSAWVSPAPTSVAAMPGLLKESVKTGQAGGHPFERLGRQPVDEVARAWLPPRAGRVVVGPSPSCQGARHSLQEIDSPHGLIDHNRASRVDRALQLARFEQPYLQAHTAFGAVLVKQRVGVDEVKVTHHHADPFETRRRRT
jgi:hypothetical protein